MADVAQASTGEPASPKDKPEQQLQQAEASDSAPQAHAAAQPAAETSSFASQAAEHGAAPDAPQITFKVQYGKNSADLKRPASSTVGDLKAEVEKTLSIPPSMQKLMYKGLLKNDTDTLEKVGIRNGAKVLLIGSSQADIAAAKPEAATAGADGSKLNWDAPKQDEDICKQTQHAKVIAKGPPEDALPGIKDKQVPLPDSLNNFNGLYNSTGTKVRLTFKPESQQLWIASATNTQRIPYGSISKIESWLIQGHEGYSILALHLGSGGSSKYWLYFFPSQYVSGIKIRLIGLHALL
eukprot:GHRR01007216.1.p1 GENE.GHRR01007216.1~~GHRR01007216.1.p1  ORF type:complete len:295 (+),score=86.84 GHRR01007216.1:1136-2020(+)